LVIDKKKLVKELDLDIFVEDEIKSETWSPGNEK
jgi:hypothetical protein